MGFKALLMPPAIVAGTPVAPPVADFTRVITNLSVAFTDTSTNTPTSWSWNFGDGNTSTLQNPTHVYAGQGTYSVVLTATNAGGSDASAPQNVSVNTAFHAAVVAVGATYFYDHQEASGTTADNSGSAGTDATYTSVTLGQADITGTNDAGLYNSDSDQLAWPTLNLSTFTLGFIVRSIGTVGAGKSLFSGAGDGDMFISVASGALVIGATMSSLTSTAALETDTVLTADTDTLVFIDFGADGNFSVMFSSDGTLNTPATLYQETAAIGDFIGLLSATSKCNIGASGGVCGSVFLSAKLTTPQKQAIADSIWP